MGACGSSPETIEDKQAKVKNEAYKVKLNKKKEKWQQIHKLLLLGAGESGKSTLFKQMIQIYGNPEDKVVSSEELKNQVELIHGNIITNTNMLSDQCAVHGPPETEAGRAALNFFETKFVDNIIFDLELVNHLKAFWADPGIQKTYDKRNLFQLNDSAKYFYDNLDRIAAIDYVPSLDDNLRTRVRTTGIVEHNFTISESPFRMFDVGGQRNERKKWIHCFDGVTAVIFVVAISEFDQLLFEDDCTNRMTEALSLFVNICGSEWFNKTAMILFLNKSDIFMEKIQTKDITASSCPELKLYEGDCRDYDETTKYIQEVFVSRGANACTYPEKMIHAHVTNATNTENVHMVFEDVKEIVINISLDEAGLQ